MKNIIRPKASRSRRPVLQNSVTGTARDYTIRVAHKVQHYCKNTQDSQQHLGLQLQRYWTCCKQLVTKVSAWQNCMYMKTPNEEIYGKSTQGTYCWKVHSVGYNADNMGLSSFVTSYSRCCLPNSRNRANFRQRFDLTAVQAHPRSSILMSIESSYATSY